MKQVRGWSVLLAALLWSGGVGCGDESASGAGSMSDPAEEDAGVDVGAADAALEDAPSLEDVSSPDAAEEAPDVESPEEDASAPEPDAGEPVVACEDDGACSSGRRCLEGVCVLVPGGRAYVEYNFILEEPTSLTSVVSLLKGFLSGTGFFMVSFDAEAGADGTLLGRYGGASRLEVVEDGPDVYAWQFPVDQLPELRVRPALPEEAPDPSNPTDTWVSDVFDYRLMAIFTFNGVQSVLGFEAKQTVMTATFSEDLETITGGRLEGYITREEAESRLLNLDDPDCLISRGICPGFECGVDAPLMSIADVLDCNGAVMNADVDPEIEGHDAYMTSIFFESRRVLVEE